MKVKVFLMLDIDEEENILPIDDGIEDAVQGIIENLIFDVDGIEIKSIKVTHDKRTTNRLSKLHSCFSLCKMDR